MSNPLINYLQLFGTISVADQELIEAATQLRIAKEGAVLAGLGKVCREMFFICKGVLRIVRENEKGNDVTHYFLKENQFCTIMYSFTNQLPTEESIQAACDAEVLVLQHDALYALYQELPHLKTIMDEIIQKALIEKIQTRNAYLGEDSTTRYKNFIMRQPDIALRVPLSDVASYLGITPQSLSRIRKNIS
jgi:CRP-like cAMP-binding protein